MVLAKIDELIEGECGYFSIYDNGMVNYDEIVLIYKDSEFNKKGLFVCNQKVKLSNQDLAEIYDKLKPLIDKKCEERLEKFFKNQTKDVILPEKEDRGHNFKVGDKVRFKELEEIRGDLIKNHSLTKNMQRLCGSVVEITAIYRQGGRDMFEADHIPVQKQIGLRFSLDWVIPQQSINLN